MPEVSTAPRRPMIRLNRHPPNARMARNGVILGLCYYLGIGVLSAIPLYLVLDEPGSDLSHESTFAASLVGVLSCLLVVVATATALLDHRWATPGLIVLGLCGWVVGVLAVVLVAGGDVEPETFGMALLLLAARPRLLLRNYLGGLTMAGTHPASPTAR
ncbi:hypothetical protein ACGFIW_25975 [Micromonospora sp. NPDC048935]|uniref:hypothetical protein n=1 Tax=Micromonospora sp. NPDC048935 TaxID=3364262 RepID=UPI00371823F8